MGHRSYKSQRKIIGLALHHPLILTSTLGIVYLQHIGGGRGRGRSGEKENDCISEGIKRADMDGGEVTCSDTSSLSY